jgi:hypothetical protein
MAEYITNADFLRQKSALTRAINSKDPLKVLATVEKTLDEWGDKCWPDAWSRWSVALYDAWLAYERNPSGEELRPGAVAHVERFRQAYERFS